MSGLPHPGWRTFVDRGGTYTDVVTVAPDGTVTVLKVPSDRAVLGELARGQLVFGTTVATNALLEGTGDAVTLIATRGFGDLPLLGDMTRPSLFEPDLAWPQPLCTATQEVGGRIGPDGAVLEPLPAEDLHALGELRGSVAVVLLHGAVNPVHELAVERALSHCDVTCGHRVVPELGYLARVETTLVDAAISPVLRRALRRDGVPADSLALRSDGTLCPVGELRAPDAVLSGPAGGVLAVAEVARMAGFRSAVGLDMGGTSTDVCRVEVDRLPLREEGVRVAGRRVARPMLEVETIAAGGGSVLRHDGLRLLVGPDSAGAHPGPACRGRGGPPTLTDAALLAGLVDPDAFDPPLDPSLVQLPGPAEAFLDIAREHMAGAVRRLAAGRGVDVRDHALVAFGGAAGQHACHVAERLGMRTVLVHPCAAALSAWGMALASRTEQVAASVWRRLPEAEATVRQLLDDLAARLEGSDGREVRVLELRRPGTEVALRLELPTPWTWAGVRSAFATEHERRLGAWPAPGDLEVVNARVLRIQAATPLPSPSVDDPFGVADGATGPIRLDCPTTSVLVPEGWAARWDGRLLRIERAPALPAVGHRVLRGTAAPSLAAPAGAGGDAGPAGAVAGDGRWREAHPLALWGARFAAVAEEAGEALRRLARSVNMRERRDFSCAVFDGTGRLVANAPHIPVHLGAMGVTVRDLLDRLDPAPDRPYLCNDPAAGGSHLPDLTVSQVVELGDGVRVAVACRGHHVDVGGVTPGSMPSRSRRLDEEGLVFRQVALEDDQGGWLPPPLPGCRDPQCVQADLLAQAAANRVAADRLRALAAAHGPREVEAWMHALNTAARVGVERLAACLPAAGRADDVLDGVPLRLLVWVERGRVVVDLTGTGGPHQGNLNAPEAVVRAAVLYALRVLATERLPDLALPLNEGTLEAVELRLPEGSVVSPPPGSAVVGGNVETSQRLVDLLLRAAGSRAASQGTMNNLALGGPGWAFYETLGGGSGAGPGGPGVSGRHVHMTNTRATDPEVLEARLPLRVRRFALRRGSGGAGRHVGGDGLERELELLAPATATLLATRRRSGAPGEHGGGRGLPGEDHWIRAGCDHAWDGAPLALLPGDRLRIRTPGGGGWEVPETVRGGSRGAGAASGHG